MSLLSELSPEALERARILPNPLKGLPVRSDIQIILANGRTITARKLSGEWFEIEP